VNFEIEIAGRSRSVSVERTGIASRYRVKVDGRIHVIDARRSGDHGLLLAAATFPAKVTSGFADNSHGETGLAAKPDEGGDADVSTVAVLDTGVAPTYEVFVAPADIAGELLVTIEGRPVTVAVNGRRTRRGVDTAGQADGEQSVVAPMPGRVVRVLVAPGDEVAARQGVVVVEAMKMENELRSPKAGRVKNVSVAAGTSVEAGRVLVIIE
jgi:biotin carboxyl carrier protein